MNSRDSKRRKISRQGFLEHRYFILETLGYYTDDTKEKALRETYEARFRDVVRPIVTHGQQPSMNILEVMIFPLIARSLECAC